MQKLFDDRDQLEARYLQHNIIPPPLGPYPPPSHLTFRDDIIKDITISPPPAYLPLQKYLDAWKAIISPIKIPVQELIFNESSIINIMKNPNTIPFFNTILQTKLLSSFGKPNSEEATHPLCYPELNHLSSKLHRTTNYINLTTLTWANNHQIEENDWKGFFQQINNNIFTNPSGYYYLYALNTGLLNNTFYRNCLCNLSFSGSPIRHVIQECQLTITIYQFFKNQHNQQHHNNLTYGHHLLICPTNISSTSIKFLNDFIHFLVYCHRVAYAKRPEILPWNNDTTIEEIYLTFRYR